MFTMDTLYNSGQAGLTKAMDAEQMTTAILALSGIIGLNIAATIFHHMVDPDSLREQAEEEAFDKVESATLKQIAHNAEQLAAQLAPTLAADWMRQTQARYMANIGTGNVGKILDLPAQDVAPAPMMRAQPAQKNKFDLWRFLFNKINDGRNYQSVVNAQPVTEAQPTAAAPTSSAESEVAEMQPVPLAQGMSGNGHHPNG
jgi:hypothetical protein